MIKYIILLFSLLSLVYGKCPEDAGAALLIEKENDSEKITSITLVDSNIKENVALGSYNDEINSEKIWHALKDGYTDRLAGAS